MLGRPSGPHIMGERMVKPFRDRAEAGRALAGKLAKYANRPDVVVLALPRGGVPVAYEVARALGASMDVFLVRKLGVPGREELAMGAIASGGVRILNREVVSRLQIAERVIDAVASRESQELQRRERDYRDDRPVPVVRGRVVILVDDGLATGSTMRSAVAALRPEGPSLLVVAVPVAAPSACEEFQDEADEVVLRPDARAVLRGRILVRRLLADDRRGGARPAGAGLGRTGR